MGGVQGGHMQHSCQQLQQLAGGKGGDGAGVGTDHFWQMLFCRHQQHGQHAMHEACRPSGAVLYLVCKETHRYRTKTVGPESDVQVVVPGLTDVPMGAGLDAASSVQICRTRRVPFFVPRHAMPCSEPIRWTDYQTLHHAHLSTCQNDLK